MRKSIRTAFVLVGLAFVAFGVVQALREGRAVIPSVATVITVLLLSGLAIAGAAASWSALFPDHPGKSRLRSAFVTSQVGKHLPLGGAFQALGQAAFSIDDVVTRSRATVGLASHALVQIAAASLVAFLVALSPDMPVLARVVGGASLLLVLLVHRSWLKYAVARLAPRFGYRRPDPGALVPSQRATIVSVAFGLIPIVSASLAFALVLNDLAPNSLEPHVIPSFALAWLAGYLTIPVPAGLGIREAVLVALLGHPIGIVVAASVSHRILSMVVEAVVAAIAWRKLGKSEQVRI